MILTRTWNPHFASPLAPTLSLLNQIQAAQRQARLTSSALSQRFAQPTELCQRLSSYTQSLVTRTEDQSGYTFKLQLPELVGRDVKELELHLEGETLQLNIPPLKLPYVADLKPIWREIATQARTLHFRIPPRVDAASVSATLSGDTLEIKLPLLVPKRDQIEITGASSPAP